MEREIKFRAISPVNTDESKAMQYYNLVKIFDLNRFAADDWAIEQLMQFTGLTDKNGKEIYEGDIIKIEWDICEATTEIITYDSEFCYWKYGNNPICEISENRKSIDVIGNIYETPNLLKQ